MFFSSVGANSVEVGPAGSADAPVLIDATSRANVELPMEEGAVRLARVGAGAKFCGASAERRRWSAVRYTDEAEAGRRVIAQRADLDAMR